jgi:hypothetical protein
MTRPAYAFRPCKFHPGRNVRHHPCDHRYKDDTLCGWSPNSEVEREVKKPEPHLSLVKSQEEEAPMDTAVMDKPQADIETGEIFKQPTLDPEMFPAIERRSVPMVKIGFGGSVEMTQREWEAYCDQGLECGRVVKLTLTGYLPDPHAKWVKRTEKDEDGDKSTWWEQEGQIKIKALELGSFELRGIYDGE